MLSVEKAKPRNSSIELLKIIGLILIVISHAVPCYSPINVSYIDINYATNSIETFIMIIFRNMGYIGNIIFIMCSSYFLLDKTNIKAKKVWYMIVDCLVISVIYAMIYYFIYNLPIKTVIKQFFPITFQTNWFIGCYILFYLIHPLLNKIIYSLKKKNLLHINIFLIILYVVINWILGGHWYYYNNLLGFIIIYFIVGYNKNYLLNISKSFSLNIKILLIGILGFLTILILTNLLGLKLSIFSNKMMYWHSLVNPFIIMIGISLLNLFLNKNFENKFINYISSLSLIFYIIHENVLFRTYTRSEFYDRIFTLGDKLVCVLIGAILLFIYGIVLSIIYKQFLQKFIYKISDKIFTILVNSFNKIDNFLLKLN